MSSNERVIQMACLGRPFRLGMLYDCRNDQLIPGITLWNNEMLKGALNSTPQEGSDFEVIAEDSLEAKASQLNVSGSLKLSFMGGLIDVSGSAKYLYDRKSSKQQSRVSLKYWSTSKFDQLTMDQLGNIEYPKVFSNKIATHVVVGVLYGADAFLIFDRMMNEGERVHDVHGEVQALVKCLPSLLDIKGQVGLGLSKKDKAAASKLECKFHGDLQLQKNPTTFQDAIEVFQQLPVLLKGENGPVVVPKQVWLHPLSNLNSDAAQIVHEISISLVSQAQNVMEELLEYDMHCNDLVKTKECSYFTGMQSHISKFKGMVLQYRMEISKKLSQLLPNIREGGTEESRLADLFQSKEASPFSSHSLKGWLQIKESEVKILARYLKSLKKISFIEFALSVGDLDAIIHDPECEYALCFGFQMLKSDDPNLEQMQLFLTTQQFSGKQNEAKSWFKDEGIMAGMRKNFKQFTTFAKANEKRNGMKFVVADLSEQRTDGATIILLYRNGVAKLFDPPTTPDGVKDSCVTQNSITVEWSKPEYGSDSVQCYTVQYGQREENGSIDQWLTKKTAGSETRITVDGLQSATSYCFKMRAECEAGVSEFSEVSSTISTFLAMKTCPTQKSYRLAEYIKVRSTLLPNEGGPPAYKITGREIDLPGKMFQKVVIGHGEATRSVPEKVLMVVGATGAGKTTLINGMINYIFGVRWKDNFQFKLITEEARSQAKSQTKSITAYTICCMDGSVVDYDLTIIDTPGFGSGVKRDKEITKQIKDCFSVMGSNGISHLDGIGFVTQSALARLTPTQQYIFNSILSIFGKDVSKNIFMMTTFADGQKPPVISSIEAAGIPHSGFFKFNNSALFAETSSDHSEDDEDEDNFDEMFWTMGVNLFKKFFVAFRKAQSVSLTMTEKVLEQRDRLETIIVGLQGQMKECLAEMEVLRQEEMVLKEHEKDIEDSTYQVKVPYYEREKLPKDVFVTNCLRCSVTCHYPCKIPDNDDKMRCAAMDDEKENAKCTVCDGGCHWSEHKNTGDRLILKHRMETRTYTDLKRKYESAAKGKKAVEEMLSSCQRQLEEAHTQLHLMIEEAQQCLKRLDEIALKPNPLTQVEYIQLLINSEKQEAKEGWMDRVKYLETTKEQAEFLAMMKEAKDTDKHIAEEKQKREPGWEKRVEKLEQVKRIRAEVENIKETRRQQQMKGIWNKGSAMLRSIFE